MRGGVRDLDDAAAHGHDRVLRGKVNQVALAGFQPLSRAVEAIFDGENGANRIALERHDIAQIDGKVSAVCAATGLARHGARDDEGRGRDSVGVARRRALARGSRLCCQQSRHDHERGNNEPSSLHRRPSAGRCLLCDDASSNPSRQRRPGSCCLQPKGFYVARIRGATRRLIAGAQCLRSVPVESERRAAACPSQRSVRCQVNRCGTPSGSCCCA